MPVKISDPTTAEALGATATPQDLVGPDGRVLGRFLPTVPGMRFPELGITDAELERRLNAPAADWVSGEQVLARLRSLRDAG